MMGLWFGSPTFGASGRLVRNPTSIRRGDAGLRPYSNCPGSRNNIVRVGSGDQAARSSLHSSERYRWLNDSLSVGVGEVRSQENGTTELIVEWSELVWEPLEE
jgi:hypothetical protein